MTISSFYSTGDHVLLESEDFSTVQNPHQITIRSTTATKESYDSCPIFLTPQLLSEVKETVVSGFLLAEIMRDD